jgi:exopolysaccharide biosynthesis polyprenyl glycosylphosphotransferase
MSRAAADAGRGGRARVGPAPRVRSRLLRWLLDPTGALERRVLVAGSGPRALRLAAELTDGCRLVGFVDEEWPGLRAFRARGLSLAGDLKNLGAALREQPVDELLVALPWSVLQRRHGALLEACRRHGVTVRWPQSALAPLPDDGARDEIVLSLYHGELEGAALVGKRLLDLALAFCLLVGLAPLLALAALTLRLASPGPVLFLQERVGLHGRRFRLHKFRTMVPDAESRQASLEHLNETGGATFKMRDDPRVTRIGRWLRRTSIDELPQLVNVLRGEMSLVGPRPLPVRDVERFEDDRHRRRLAARPGVTGLWQVSGRSGLPFEMLIELDLAYVDRWSPGLDARILARTVPAVLGGEGAE